MPIKIATCQVRKRICTIFALVTTFFLMNIIFISKFHGPTRNQEKVIDRVLFEWENEERSPGAQKAVNSDDFNIDQDLLDLERKLVEGKNIDDHVSATPGNHVDIFQVFTQSRFPAEAAVNERTTLNAAIDDEEQNVVNRTTSYSGAGKMAVLVIACNRVSVGRCLDGIFKYKPAEPDMPVIVSQDCGDDATAKVIQSYGSKLKHIQHSELGNVPGVPGNMVHFMDYYKISRHYKWALTQVFSDPGIGSVIIVEDDLDIAPDFFNLFLATRPLLDKDPTIFCVSAWNDNGREGFVDGVDTLHRTDFFPGLGWLLTRKIWDEFKGKWPLGFWDDWVRHPDQRKDRVCIRPEISRTRTFGRVGVSIGQFFDQYLKFIKLNADPYPFEDYDMSFLMKENYDRAFFDEVNSAPEFGFLEVLDGRASKHPAVRITYADNGQFENLARQFGLMTDLKAGVPRTAYNGVVAFFRNKQRIYLAPKAFQGYSE